LTLPASNFRNPQIRPQQSLPANRSSNRKHVDDAAYIQILPNSAIGNDDEPGYASVQESVASEEPGYVTVQNNGSSPSTLTPREQFLLQQQRLRQPSLLQQQTQQEGQERLRRLQQAQQQQFKDQLL
jgi:hypothetical protein